MAEDYVSDAYMTRADCGEALLAAVSLYAQRAQVRRAIRARGNDLRRSVEERRALLARLGAAEQELTDGIDALVGALDAGDAERLRVKYEESEAAS